MTCDSHKKEAWAAIICIYSNINGMQQLYTYICTIVTMLVQSVVSQVFGICVIMVDDLHKTVCLPHNNMDIFASAIHWIICLYPS